MNARQRITDLDINERFDREIDPFLFIDGGGRFYFYTVKFDRGNIIYGQATKALLDFKGHPVRLLDPRPENGKAAFNGVICFQIP